MNHEDILGWSLSVYKTGGNISKVININYSVRATGYSYA
jgi:hypothetical protein